MLSMCKALVNPLATSSCLMRCSRDIRSPARVCKLVLPDCSGLGSTPQFTSTWNPRGQVFAGVTGQDRAVTRAGPNPSISTTSVPYTCASGVTSHTPSTTGALGPGGEMLEEVSRESGATASAHTAPEKSTTGPNPRPTAERQQPRLRPQSQGGSDTRRPRRQLALAGDLATRSKHSGQQSTPRPQRARFPWPRGGHD